MCKKMNFTPQNNSLGPNYPKISFFLWLLFFSPEFFFYYCFNTFFSSWKKPEIVNSCFSFNLLIRSKLEAGLVEKRETHISAKKQSVVLTNHASSYQSRARLGSIHMSVWPNCSVWCGGENQMLVPVSCLSDIVSKLIIIQQCRDTWKRRKL